MKASVKAISIITSVLITFSILAGCTSPKLSGDQTSENTTSPIPAAEQQSTGSPIPEQTAEVSPTVSAEQTVTPSVTPSPTPVPSVSGKVKVKALYLTGWTVGSMKKVQHYVDLANSTELNSYVVDIKDDDGLVGYKSQVPEVINNGAWESKYDVDKVLAAFHKGGVHVIGRIVCFKDPVYSIKNPALAIQKIGGGVWKDSGKLSWLNPYKQENWDYLIKIAKEASAKGFDEIQFDYVRFPSDGKKTTDYGTQKKKYEAINEFLAYAKKEMPGVIVSADVFGIICESPDDTEKIGQYLELVGKDVDYISPMAYPSHYALGQTVNGVRFAKPDLEPYKVVYNTLLKAKNRIQKLPEGQYKAEMRPYLQDFTASWLRGSNYMNYGTTEVRQQIKAVYDAGYEEWILWDAMNTYDEGALLKQ